jgi:hypothetical protein
MGLFVMLENAVPINRIETVKAVSIIIHLNLPYDFVFFILALVLLAIKVMPLPQGSMQMPIMLFRLVAVFRTMELLVLNAKIIDILTPQSFITYATHITAKYNLY